MFFTYIFLFIKTAGATKTVAPAKYYMSKKD